MILMLVPQQFDLWRSTDSESGTISPDLDNHHLNLEGPTVFGEISRDDRVNLFISLTANN